MNVKRLQGVSVTGQMVAAAFPSGTIPESARFMHAYFDYERNVFVCVFEDEGFAEVPEGCRIPIDVDNNMQSAPYFKQDVVVDPNTLEIVKHNANTPKEIE